MKRLERSDIRTEGGGSSMKRLERSDIRGQKEGVVLNETS